MLSNEAIAVGDRADVLLHCVCFIVHKSAHLQINVKNKQCYIQQVHLRNLMVD